MDMLVKEIMQKDVFTLAPELGLDALEQQLCSFKVGGAPVVDKGKVIGVVSRSDIFTHLGIRSSYIAMAESGSEPGYGGHSNNIHSNRFSEGIMGWTSNLKVKDIMSKSVLSISSNQSLKEAGELMIEKKVHRLMVMDQGELVGIISSMDFVKHSI